MTEARTSLREVRRKLLHINPNDYSIGCKTKIMIVNTLMVPAKAWRIHTPGTARRHSQHSLCGTHTAWSRALGKRFLTGLRHGIEDDSTSQRFCFPSGNGRNQAAKLLQYTNNALPDDCQSTGANGFRSNQENIE